MADAEEQSVAIFASRWAVLELPGDVRRLVVVTAERLVRISSPITAWNSETRIATTESGQSYELDLGYYGWINLSHSNFGVWLDRHNMSWDDVKEVSQEYGDPRLPTARNLASSRHYLGTRRSCSRSAPKRC